MRISTPLFIAGALLSGASQAQNLTASQASNQPAFRALSEDLGAALSFKPMIPAEPLGLTGFDIGLGITQTKLEQTSAYGNALEGDSYVYLPTIRAHKGLPFGIDLGVAYAKASGSNIEYVGGELRYAILDGGIAMPALALRGSMSRLTGIDDLDFDTRGVDLSISKGLLMFKPYAGAGKVWIKSDPKFGGIVTSESFSLNKVFVGVGFNMLLLNVNLEADKTGEATSYSAKLGLRF
jgi:hypothetical protein